MEPEGKHRNSIMKQRILAVFGLVEIILRCTLTMNHFQGLMMQLEGSDNGAGSLEAPSSDPESQSWSKSISGPFQQAQIWLGYIFTAALEYYPRPFAPLASRRKSLCPLETGRGGADALMGGAGAGAAGGGRAARALRLLLLAVLTLAALEYLFGSILEASPIRTYLYAYPYNSTPPTVRDHKLTPNSMKRIHPSTATGVHAAEFGRNTSLNTSEAVSSNSNVTSMAGNVTSHNSTSQGVTSQNVPSYESSTPLLITKIMESLRYLVTTESELKDNATKLPLCPEMPPDLGPIEANKTEIELDVVERRFPEVRRGGRYRPRACAARHRVAIIVPYRDRQQHLAIFLNHMHPFLMKQQIDYGIFIIEQQVSLRVIQNWFKRFEFGNFDVVYERRFGRPVMDKVDAILEKVEQDRSISSYEIAEELRLYYKRVLTPLKKAGYAKKFDTGVPHELTERNEGTGFAREFLPGLVPGSPIVSGRDKFPYRESEALGSIAATKFATRHA
ncbi:Beta-1,4-N-acetylgalactosaminyltransferase bre-4 [Eumeta japonica]|uniref:Beta-1,4-N-acetylgalactosaminyltransferase bre-4 n=1 Tax=Eumeta variegata TaxID=151549 RepID=A0A4C1ZHU2_EUMVA|nr:Beta-1,4-N-acetylgalactosaminyltransferase bre-4 [Eumeta japonica]